MSCVYIHINKINGKVYVGKTDNKPEFRWNGGKGYRSCPLFYHAIKKYSWDGFTHEVVLDGLTWSLELYQQANARLYRQGQQKPVIIHHLIAEGTVDEQVMRAIKSKDTSQAALLAALKERNYIKI